MNWPSLLNKTKKFWNKTNLSSRKCYLSDQAPSSASTIPTDGLPLRLKGIDPTLVESETGYKNFVVIENSIKNIEWLKLSSKGHRRLNINLEKNQKKFQWIIP